MLFLLFTDCQLPNELSASLKRLNSSLVTLENDSKSEYDTIQKEFELYKKRSKTATSLLQEKNDAMSKQIETLQQEVLYYKISDCKFPRSFLFKKKCVKYPNNSLQHRVN